jgi:hypothetical protein
VGGVARPRRIGGRRASQFVKDRARGLGRSQAPPRAPKRSIPLSDGPWSPLRSPQELFFQRCPIGGMIDVRMVMYRGVEPVLQEGAESTHMPPDRRPPKSAGLQSSPPPPPGATAARQAQGDSIRVRSRHPRSWPRGSFHRPSRARPAVRRYQHRTQAPLVAREGCGRIEWG